MKKEKMLLAMNEIDEKYIAEAAPRSAPSASEKRYRWTRFAVVVACLCIVVTALGLVLFLPYNTNPPDVSEYADSEYYAVIQKINAVNYVRPRYKNNFQRLLAGVSNLLRGGAEKQDGSMGVGIANGNETYQEATDNQVAGIIEADRIKRSDKFIYYLNGASLEVYSIQGDASEQVGSYYFKFRDGTVSFYSDDWEFFLSPDCKTVTVLAPCIKENRGACVAVLSVDVSDPAKITEKSTVLLSGSYLSSRMADGKLLLLSEFHVEGTDFSSEENFLPQIDTGNGFQSIPAENIFAPETLTTARYTVVCKFDGATLTLEDCAAFLSYSEEVYVSAQNIYLTRSFSEETVEGKYRYRTSMTEISCLSYAGEAFGYPGSVTVAGYVNNQYSLDEYENILRVVTTTNVSQYAKGSSDSECRLPLNWSGETSASLYCIDLDSWQITAEVKNFAPKGETVRSVRFDRDAAYVCTSVVLSDPVFFFDLSDLSNITYKDTGTIDGYSTSLVNFGNGYLLGIGIGAEWNTAKFEIYEETANGVSSVCKFELPGVSFSSEYKSYLIDRENRLIGFGFSDDAAEYTGGNYLLLSFDGYSLHEVANVPLSGNNSRKRAVYIDGYLYTFGPNGFQVVPVWQNNGETAE